MHIFNWIIIRAYVKKSCYLLIQESAVFFLYKTKQKPKSYKLGILAERSAPRGPTAEAAEAGRSPGAGVGVGVPWLLFHPQRRFGQDGAEPAGDVHADVVDLVGVLARATRAVRVGLVLQDLHPAALAAALLPALFLRWSNDMRPLGSGIEHRLEPRLKLKFLHFDS